MKEKVLVIDPNKDKEKEEENENNDELIEIKEKEELIDPKDLR